MDLLCEKDSKIDAASPDLNAELLQPDDADYLNFLAKIKEPIEAIANPFIDSKEDSDSDCEIYQDEGASSESEEDYSQESQENVESADSKAQNSSNSVLI